MGVVGGKDQHFGPDILNDPPDGFAGEGRHSNMLAGDFRGGEVHGVDALQRLSGEVECFQPCGQPKGTVFHRDASKPRMALEDAVKNHCRKKQFGAVFDRDHAERCGRSIATEFG